MEIRIQLQKSAWAFDDSDRLGEAGGFGEVFRGHDETGSPVAVKRLNIDAKTAAYRELRVVELLGANTYEHIIPYLDAGQDANSDSYFVVMPIAEKNLSEYVTEIGKLDEQDALQVLQEIVNGIVESERIIHRDLKPDNILLHEGKWKLADFGIAKFVEESTSMHTLKDCWSAPYAAPEQWKLEELTRKTDLYALACIGYFLLSGGPPFGGPTREDFRRQHLEEQPAELANVKGELRALISMLLRKDPESRPSLDRVQALLGRLSNTLNSEDQTVGNEGFSALAEAGASVATAVSEAEAKAKKNEAKKKRRLAIAEEAKISFTSLRERFFEKVIELAPAASVEEAARVRLGGAVIVIQLHGSAVFSRNLFIRSGWDVLMGGSIALRQSTPTFILSSSLWYCKTKEDNNFRWREVSYCINPAAARQVRQIKNQEPFRYEPFLLDDPAQADAAACRVVGVFNIAYGPQCIDDEDTDSFLERWCDLISRAVNGTLHQMGR